MARITLVIELEGGEEANLIDVLKGDDKIGRVAEFIKKAEEGTGPAKRSGVGIGEKHYRLDFIVPVSELG